MKIVTIDKSLMLKYAGDLEILQKDNRPCVLIVYSLGAITECTIFSSIIAKTLFCFVECSI